MIFSRQPLTFKLQFILLTKSQESHDLIYTAAETWNHTLNSLFFIYSSYIRSATYIPAVLECHRI
jgi:hypothetical protein